MVKIFDTIFWLLCLLVFTVNFITSPQLYTVEYLINITAIIFISILLINEVCKMYVHKKDEHLIKAVFIVSIIFIIITTLFKGIKDTIGGLINPYRIHISLFSLIYMIIFGIMSIKQHSWETAINERN